MTARLDVLSVRQQRITGRTLADIIQEADNFLRVGGEKFGISAPPLRVRAMQFRHTVRNSNSVPMNDNTAALYQTESKNYFGKFDVLQTISIASIPVPHNIAERGGLLRWTSYEQFTRDETSYINGSDQWTHIGNDMIISKKHPAVEAVVVLPMNPLCGVADDGAVIDQDNWLWENSPEVYTAFIVARAYQEARVREQAERWFGEYAGSVIRLNRTYGDSVILKGARFRYRGAGQLGRRYNRLWY